MRRSPTRAAERERIVEGFQGSGSVLSDYCTAQGISVDQFYQWRRNLFGPKYKKRQKRSSFIELGSASMLSNRDTSALQLEIEVAGITIRVRK